jgi:hypothetical protein
VLDGLWAQEVVNFQCDGLSVDAQAHERKASGEGGLFQQLFHSESS